MLKVRSNVGSFSQNFFRVAAAPLIALLILMGAVSASTYTAGTTAVETSLSTTSYIVCQPAVTVTSLLDSGSGSLRQAIIDACSGGTITFAVTGTIGITSGEIVLPKDVNIIGPGADQLTISHTTPALAIRVFTVDPGWTVNISGVTISNPYGGSVYTGGIFSDGNLSLDRVVLTGINAGNSSAVGSRNGSLSITNSTISNNTSLNQAPAVYAADSSLSIVNTTISGNTCRTQGGGVFFTAHHDGPYALNITNSTITNNTAGPEGDSSGGGGISVYSAIPTGSAINATLTNTIVSGNSPNNFKVDLDGGYTNAVYISGGHNIDGDGISGFINGVNGDKVGTASTPLNAMLAPLGANGGPTPTHALLAGSPAIDGGLNLNGLATDQRGAGFLRTVDLAAANSGDGTDIGAFESQTELGYNFIGFFQPVDNLPTVNSVNAGQAIALKFSLSGNQGSSIFALGYPRSVLAACDANAADSPIDQTVTAGGSSLSYDAITDQYGYVWKTDKSWKGTCRVFVLRLADGTEHYAKFRFR